MDIKKLDEKQSEKNYNLSKKESIVQEYLKKRIEHMQFYRTESGCEERWRNAEDEYLPFNHSKTAEKSKYLETADELLGLRTRVVQVGDGSESWRSHNSEPTLFVKINTALSILLEKNPEAFFEPASRKYEATTKLAHSLWKTSWIMDRSKSQLQLFMTDLMKYGVAYGKTSPLIIKRSKSVLTSIDPDDIDNKEYEQKEIVDFNGIHRQRLNPWKVWVDEMTKPNDPLSTNDWYYELDYDYDQAALLFKKYKNWEYVKRDAQHKEDDDDSDHKEQRGNIVTVGFYESKNKDLYCIYIPSQELLLHYSPLPNDDGKLSLWYANWIIGDPSSIYKGISLWDIISQKKSIFDRFMNMTVDQLTLSIYKMWFYSGTNNNIGDGNLKITPGRGVQNLGGKVDWLNVPGPGQEAFEGIKMIAAGIDDDSGITPTMQGEVTGKTLGEILNAKESALKRLNVPLENIMFALETEAYISLSWLTQILSTPEVKEFANIEELQRYERETQLNNFEYEESESGGVMATFFQEVPLKLKKEGDILVEAKETRFFQIGKDIGLNQIRWEGIIHIVPKSLLSPSEALQKQSKLELFNLLVPMLSGDPQIFAKPAKQILVIYDEAPEDWLPATWISFLETGQMPQPQEPLFISPEEQILGGTNKLGQTDDSVRGSAQTMQEGQKLSAPEMQTVVPQGQVSTPSTNSMGGVGQGFKGLFK